MGVKNIYCEDISVGLVSVLSMEYKLYKKPEKYFINFQVEQRVLSKGKDFVSFKSYSSKHQWQIRDFPEVAV